jgi:protein involved in polysaccharide export with SLBB domain
MLLSSKRHSFACSRASVIRPNSLRALLRHIVCFVATAAILTAFSQTSHSASKDYFQGKEPQQDLESPKDLPGPAPSPETYHLDTGDTVRVRFYDRYDRDDLNSDQVISESGKIRLPRIGSFDARNRTTEAIERDIRDAIEKKREKLGYFSLEVIRCRPFYIVGLVNRPGPYVYVPGLTVLQAVSLAGGLYRSPETTREMMQMHEETTLIDTTSRLAEAIARRARLGAESNESQVVGVPQELMQLEPLKAHEIIAVETTQLNRSRQSLNRQKTALEDLVALKQAEIDSHKLEINRLSQRIDEQTKVFSAMQKLHQDRIVNQQRFLEAVIALDGLKREKQANTVSLSIANTELEKARRDLAVLLLDYKVRVAKELRDTDFEVMRLKRIAAHIADYEAIVGNEDYGRVAVFRIVRGNLSAPGESIKADETTQVMPGDVIKVDVKGDPKVLADK